MKRAKTIDAVVCLGRIPSTEEGRNDLRNRVSTAVSVFKSRNAKYLILSGGYTYSKKISEAAYMMKVAREQKIPVRRIILEERSKSTYENALFVSEIARKKHLHSLAIVTSNYHLLRASLIFRKIFKGYSLMFIPSPYPFGISLIVRYIKEFMRILGLGK